MGPNGSESGWERWRGEQESRVGNVEDDLRSLWEWRNQHEAEAQKKYVEVLSRLTSVETKLVFFCALAAACGAMLPQVLAAVVERL